MERRGPLDDKIYATLQQTLILCPCCLKRHTHLPPGILLYDVLVPAPSFGSFGNEFSQIGRPI